MSRQDRPEAAAGPRRAWDRGLQHAKEVAADQLRRYAIAVSYIFVLLTVFTLHEEIALRTHGGESRAIPFAPHGFAIVNALVLGKVALVVEELGLGKRIKAEPLIVPILLESLILALLFVAMHCIESVIAGWIRGEALAKSVPAVGGGGTWGLLFATFSFFVAMIPFCGFRQVTQAIGWPKLRTVLFGRQTTDG